MALIYRRHRRRITELNLREAGFMIRGINPSPLRASPSPFCVCLALLCRDTPWNSPIPAGWLLPWNEGIRERLPWESGHPEFPGSAHSPASWHCSRSSRLLSARSMLTVLSIMMYSHFWVISKAFPAGISQPRHPLPLPSEFRPLSS